MVSTEFEILQDKPPRDHMCLSICDLLLCFPIGIVALIFSFQIRHSNKWNNRALAAETSQQVYYMAVLGIVLGSIITLAILIFLMVDLFSR
ncbi:synapse differentiation-inducing gene protein 1-like [Felis catus]|uniref:synapse differentiation-inducing gene protein 1-like n=1 Tax=Felis catus TaxID=9685 RepID=UPI001D19DC2D|nr:synapse differentiation-inducing gene protein 1-like [Felis catus]